jgi:hypothetical protein
VTLILILSSQADSWDRSKLRSLLWHKYNWGLIPFVNEVSSNFLSREFPIRMIFVNWSNLATLGHHYTIIFQLITIA